jgi:2-polyprenyl-3-methyl-5-hydroxy-6-metoxy-1,4-benzoquinol methylase
MRTRPTYWPTWMSLEFAVADRIARWNHNLQFHGWILRHVPARCESALDVGCGDGVLAWQLAARADQVTGIDVSPAMIALARRTHARSNVTYVAGDVMSSALPETSFDFIAAVAVLHHLPLEHGLARLAGLLRPRGVLAVVGLARDGTVLDCAYSAASIPLSRLVRLFTGYWDSPAPRLDPLQTFPEIRQVAAGALPHAVVRRRLFFRYSLLWRKP